jgi:hypothetical protein
MDRAVKVNVSSKRAVSGNGSTPCHQLHLAVSCNLAFGCTLVMCWNTPTGLRV